MEYRQLGRSGLKVPVLSLGTATFGGCGDLFSKWGGIDAKQAGRMLDICLEAGLNFFDTADVYSSGVAEELLGEAIKGRRERLLISTKAAFATGEGPNNQGCSRYHLIRACEASLKRLGTDHIDLFFMHGYDALTPTEEVLGALDNLIRAGKVRYIGCSNFSGWHVMKSLATSERYGLARYVCYQGCYSLISREFEWELMPLARDQGLATMVWSPLGGARLTGKIRRNQTLGVGRISLGGSGGPEVGDERIYTVVEALDEVSQETGKTTAQVALNWVLQRPTVASIVVGARNEEQLKENLGALGWTLSADLIAKLDEASRQTPIYPYWHQQGFSERNPAPTTW